LNGIHAQQIKVKIVKPDDYLRPEMNASVAFLADRKRDAGSGAATAVVLVPASAVRDNAVFVGARRQGLAAGGEDRSHFGPQPACRRRLRSAARI